MQKYSLTGQINTDSKGCQALLDFYNHASTFSNCWFNLDIENLKWIDANLVAELFLYCHLLKKRNNIKFFIDYKLLKKELNVLSRNGFAYYVVHNKEFFEPYDNRESVIPLKAFLVDDIDKFAEYIEYKFLKQRGLESLDTKEKDRIKSHYYEIFENVGIHANTETPIFCCGQYFPANGELKFTLTDFGDGFLSKIAEFTRNDINTAVEAIGWAVRGNTTKPKETKGGTGLKKIMFFCLKNGGELSIVSDGCFWCFDGNKINSFNLKNHRKGATVHLTFRYLIR